MDWITKIDWGTIIEKSAASPLGIVALGLIVLSLLVWKLFGSSGDKIKYLALITIIAGVSVLFFVVNTKVSIERDLIREKERLEKLAADCKANEKLISGEYRAYDKSGFHSSPSAHCGINLVAPPGYFFAENQVEVVSEHYRNISGVGAKDAMKPAKSEINGASLATSFSGTIGCTNSQGTGRTCVAEAQVQQRAYPAKCVEISKELRG